MVADLLELFAAVAVGIDGAADAVVMIARRALDHLFQGREFLDAELLKTDGVQPNLLGELRNIKHFLRGLADVAVDEIAVQEEVVLRQDGERRADLLLGDAFLQLGQDPVVRRFDPDEKDLEPRPLRLVEELAMLGDIDAGLDDENLLDVVFDDQIAELLAALEVREHVVVAEEHDIGGDALELLDDGFDRPLRVFPFLPERVETEGAELALERAAPRREHRVERLPAQPTAPLQPVVVVPAQRPVRIGNMREVGQDLIFVVDDMAVAPEGKPPNLLVRHARHNLLDNLLALAAHDHVDVGAAFEQLLDFQGRLITPDDRGDFIGQLGNEVADSVELRVPADADAHEIDVPADERAERRRVLVGLLVAEVEERHLADQVFHAGDDVLQAGGREQTHNRRRMGEIRVQRKNVFVCSHRGSIVEEDNARKLIKKSI